MAKEDNKQAAGREGGKERRPRLSFFTWSSSSRGSKSPASYMAFFPLSDKIAPNEQSDQIPCSQAAAGEANGCALPE